MSPSPVPDWPAQLRAQGRSMTWLAQQVGVTRTYLQDVAAGRKQPSGVLSERIALALKPPDRLASIRIHADERAAWRDVQRQALALAEAIRKALEPPGPSPDLAPHEEVELARRAVES